MQVDAQNEVGYYGKLGHLNLIASHTGQFFDQRWND